MKETDNVGEPEDDLQPAYDLRHLHVRRLRRGRTGLAGRGTLPEPGDPAVFA